MKNILIILCFVLFLTACGNTETTNQSDSDTTETSNTQEVSDAAVEEKEEVQEEVEEPKIPTVILNEAVVIQDYAEVTVKSNTFGKVINPPTPGSFYTYYENKETDQTYLDTVISTKSLLTSAKSADEFINVKIIYDNKYEYTTFATIEEQGGSDFTYPSITNIAPLQTGVLHFLASVPLQVETDGKPVKAVITVNGENFEQIIR